MTPPPSQAAEAPRLASQVSLAIAGISDQEEMLATIARRVAEALDVWECDLYEYLPESDELVAAAVWSRELTADDCTWLGCAVPLSARPSYHRLVTSRALREHHADDPDVPADEAAAFARWGVRSVLSVPLVFGDEVVGALTLVEKRCRRTFGAEDRDLLDLLAIPAAVAIHNGRVFRREAAHTRRLHALLSASQAISSTLDLDELLATVADAAGRALDSDECAINIYDERSDSLVIAAYYQRTPKEDPQNWIGQSYSLRDFPADRTTLLSDRLTIEAVSDPELDEANRGNMRENGETMHLSVPMRYEDRPIGLLVFLELDRERTYSAEELEVARALGEQAATAIHHARVLKRAEAQREQLGLLFESTKAISSSMSLDEVLATVARTSGEALGAEQCQIQDYDRAANTVTPVALWMRHRDELSTESLHQVFSLDEEPEERAFLEAMQVVEQRHSDPSLPALTRATMDKYGDKAYLNVPLVFNDQPCGLLVLVETAHERHWTDEEVALAQALGEQAAVAIEHARLYERVQAQATRDGLTGLYNHRYFYERLEQEIARARRYGTPVSLLMLDIDDFKAFNDRHGHPAGDGVLRELARILEGALRQNLDIAARYGGEEFAVILPNTPMDPMSETQLEIDLEGRPSAAEPLGEPPPPGHRDGAEAVAERIREQVAACTFTNGDGHPLSTLRVSIGAAVFPHKTGSVEDLVNNADAALYKAKRAGKDRVASYG